MARVDLDSDLMTFASLVVEVGPTVEEFAHAIGKSGRGEATVRRLRLLQSQGFVAKRGGRYAARGWVLTPKGRERLRALEEEA